MQTVKKDMKIKFTCCLCHDLSPCPPNLFLQSPRPPLRSMCSTLKHPPVSKCLQKIPS